MVVSIGAVSAPSQGVSYYERDGYYARDDPAHRDASAWAGRGAEALGLEGPVDPETFKDVLAGEVPDGTGRRLGRKNREGNVHHRPGRDLTFSAPKSVSLAALIGGDGRVAAAHDEAVKHTLAWLERDVVQTRIKDPETGRMVHAGGQKIVAATFRHDTSRNLDPQLHTHAVLANMVQGEDGKWRTMANEALYRRQKLVGMVYRAELARELGALGYRIEKTHADGRFEIAGISREVVEAFSTRRAEIEAAMEARGLGTPGADPRLAERAALMTRSHKRDVDKDALRDSWRRQAAELGFPAAEVTAAARERSGRDATVENQGRSSEAGMDRGSPEAEAIANGANGPQAGDPALRAVEWAVAHVSEREAVFARSDLIAATLAWRPGAVSVEGAERAVDAFERQGRLHRAQGLASGDGMTTDKALADEREAIALMRTGQGRGRAAMQSWMVQARLHKGPLTDGQKQAVKLILSAKDRVVGVQGYAGTGKTTMLNRARTLAEKNGYRMIGLAPSASAVKTLSAEAGIESETLQRFLTRNAGVAEGRLTAEGARDMRRAFSKTMLVVDEGSLASTVQARDLLRIARELRIPRVVLVGDEKQLDAVDAGKPFAQLQRAGMKTAAMDEILRQRDPDLKAAVEASLAGNIEKAFEKLGSNVAEVKADNIAGAVAARWLRLSPERRENTGVMAPSHELRQAINGHIRERLARDGAIRGPAFEGERLVSHGYTGAEKSLAANYAPGDVVVFHRTYKRLGVEKGEERRVAAVDHGAGAVKLEGKDGSVISWDPYRLAGRTGGAEVYRAEDIELRAGDRIRWTRNDARLGLVNSRTAEVASVGQDCVAFRLEDGRRIELGRTDPQLRHLDHAWASTVHAFQGRTVDNVIAAMEANHPHLTTQKSFYVEISRARDRAELVTDDAARLRDQLEVVTGDRVSALEGVGAMAERPPAREKAGNRDRQEMPGRSARTEDKTRDREPAMAPEPQRIEHDFGL